MEWFIDTYFVATECSTAEASLVNTRHLVASYSPDTTIVQVGKNSSVTAIDNFVCSHLMVCHYSIQVCCYITIVYSADCAELGYFKLGHC